MSIYLRPRYEIENTGLVPQMAILQTDMTLIKKYFKH